jgi:hypothetical protein
MAHAVAYAAALDRSGEGLICDRHFEGLEHVVFIKMAHA